MKATKKQILKRSLVVATVAVLWVGNTSFANNFFEIAKQIEIFTTLFKELNMNYVDDTNPGDLMDTAIKSMLEDLDPYTTFLNEQDVEAYKINNSGEYSGIGASVRSYADKVVIVEAYQGYPADQAGLKAGDEIISIDGTDLSGFEGNASELLKGARNTEVELIYKRQDKQMTAAVGRANVEVDAVPFYALADDKTGYIALTRFNRKASAQTKEALIDLKAEGAERIVLDLRGNPGGLLSEAIEIVNLFVPKGELIVTTRSKVKKFNREYRTKNKAVDTEIPLAILVDGRSASASEIVSGGLQDLDRAVILGGRSFGKGLVQRPLRLTYGTQLKVTISRYYTPSGRCIQALDYWNRDEGGNAVRNSNYQNFTTRSGRTVQDGGGVLPEILVAEAQTNDFIRSLQGNEVLFNFATDFYYKNPFKELGDFRFTPQDYQTFKNFAKKEGIQFNTPTEALLKKARESKNDLASSDIEAGFDELEKRFQQEKLKALDTYQVPIQKYIEEELLKRYFYRKGLYTHYLKEDKVIQEAISVLGNSNRYQQLLRP
ncbi:S41 family peptidase [Aureicoccus marinus]|uniref:Peptidase S41 n=1 Tax=Aureicoccus marinus TaxID=754435 RepID=A0A2S7T8K1_9FLAO|nr:S41 family peptidase [Aureicoccus marinus]PQJ16263.1 peptidase S41 [Aureicoccus marinus]